MTSTIIEREDSGAFAAFCHELGYDFMDDYVGEFEDAYCGEWHSREDYAMDLAAEMGAIPEEYSWPASYIDWERAARDLFMDYFDAPAPGGRIYVFRSI